jgi:hypothetical protein
MDAVQFVVAGLPVELRGNGRSHQARTGRRVASSSAAGAQTSLRADTRHMHLFDCSQVRRRRPER